MRELVIRTADIADAEALLAIYAPYCIDTAITFEYEVPSLDDFTDRIRHTLEKYPYIVAELDGEIVGYAYLSPFKTRKAYDWAVETSIYVKLGMHRVGIGRALYEALEKIAAEMHILNMNACIGYPDVEDEHLNRDSVRFHERMGYQMVGEFHQCGYKFNRWYSMVWMEKMLGDHTEDPGDLLTYDQVRKQIKEQYGIR